MANEDRIRQLRQKYGAKALDNAIRLHPDDFPELIEWAAELTDTQLPLPVRQPGVDVP